MLQNTNTEVNILSYKHFTPEERKSLQQFVKIGLSIREIARRLDRSPSTISRELKRNCNRNGTYNYWRANILYIMRRRYGTPRRALKKNSHEWNYIVEKLKLFWSPEEIVERYFLETGKRMVCFSTIYRYIYRGEFSKISAKKNLRRKGKRHFPRNSNYNTIHPDRIIPEWPEEIKGRIRIGDWEGDTVYGAVGKGLIVTLVDRKTRYLVAGKLENRKADLTSAVIKHLLNNLPVHSLSLDNGSEFSEFKELEKALNVPIYFAEPHKPWQRGTNENTNDILRFFFPKGTNFHAISDEEIAKVVTLINNRPRKCLRWRTPSEVFWGVALH